MKANKIDKYTEYVYIVWQYFGVVVIMALHLYGNKGIFFG